MTLRMAGDTVTVPADWFTVPALVRADAVDERRQLQEDVRRPVSTR